MLNVITTSCLPATDNLIIHDVFESTTSINLFRFAVRGCKKGDGSVTTLYGSPDNSIPHVKLSNGYTRGCIKIIII